MKAHNASKGKIEENKVPLQNLLGVTLPLESPEDAISRQTYFPLAKIVRSVPSNQALEAEDEISSEEKAEYHDELFQINFQLTMAPNCAALHLRKGLIYSCLHDYGKALKCFNEAIIADPRHAEAYYEKGVLLRTYLKDAKQAVAALDEAIKINPDYIGAYDVKGYALMDLKSYRAAVESFDQVIRIDSQNSYRVYSYHGIFGGPIELLRPDGYGAKALALEHSEEWQEVLKCYDKLIEAKPRNPHNYKGKGNALVHLKKYSEAIECFDKAITINPENFLFYYPKAFALAKLGDTAAMVAFFEVIFKKFPDLDDNTYYHKGYALSALKDYAAAIDCFNKAVKINPDFYEAHKGKAVALYHLGHQKEALKSFDELIRINHDDACAYICKAGIYSSLEKHFEAIRCYNEVIRISPSADAYNNKGWSLYKLGEHKAALECVNESLRMNSESAATLHSKGCILSALGELKESIKYFDEAIKIDPNMADAYDDKGVALSKMGDWQAAKICFDQAIKVNCDYTSAFEHRDKAVSMLGQKVSEANVSSAHDLLALAALKNISLKDLSDALSEAINHQQKDSGNDTSTNLSGEGAGFVSDFS